MALLRQRHTDLKDLSYGKVRALGGMPEAEQRLRRGNARLKRLREEERKAIRQLGADNEALVRALAQLQNEQPSAVRGIGAR